MSVYIINVVSYKRPNNNTCNLLKQTTLNWRVFVYSFDEYLQEYLKNYGEHVFIINNFEKANLALKRQLVLDTCIQEGYHYCYMLDDDISKIYRYDTSSKCSLEEALSILTLYMITSKRELIAVSACYNKSNTDTNLELYKCICNNTLFNLNVYKYSSVSYNPKSKCEDMEFTIDLILKGYTMGRVNDILIKNELQGGTTNDGLSYRFKEKNRFIEEGSYMQQRYPQLKDAFEYDEYHFKLNTNKLMKLLEDII